MADVNFQYNNGAIVRDKFDFGPFPIMLMSKLCNLHGADCGELLRCKESTSEMGGYFILNGIERVFRCVIAPKRNHPTSMVRNSICDRREGFSDKAVAIRCVRDEQSSVIVKLYYLRNGSASVGFWNFMMVITSVKHKERTCFCEPSLTRTMLLFQGCGEYDTAMLGGANFSTESKRVVWTSSGSFSLKKTYQQFMFSLNQVKIQNNVMRLIHWCFITNTSCEQCNCNFKLSLCFVFPWL